MHRVTGGSNIYISALQFRGTPEALLTLAAQRKIDLVISDHILEEVTRTLREKFYWPEERIDRIKNPGEDRQKGDTDASGGCREE